MLPVSIKIIHGQSGPVGGDNTQNASSYAISNSLALTRSACIAVGTYHSPLEGESARQGRSPPESRWGDGNLAPTL